MNKIEADLIIANYKPAEGFFDLSKKPEKLSKMDYAKILQAQMDLVHQNSHREYLIKHHPAQWEMLKEFSARLQQTILEHWGDSVFC